MEINKYTDIMGVLTTQDIVEGRMVLLTSHAHTYDFGSRADVPGVKLPANSTEAGRAKYCLTWTVSNARATSDIKLFIPQPSLEWSLRKGGWDQGSNVPFSTAVYLSYPGNQESVTIPSGWLALAFDRGVFTVPSGQFVWSASLLVPGNALEVLNIADDTLAQAGKLAYNSAGTIAVVERFNSDNGSLTFRTL